jgi:hypothetical protein
MRIAARCRPVVGGRHQGAITAPRRNIMPQLYLTDEEFKRAQEKFKDAHGYRLVIDPETGKREILLATVSPEDLYEFGWPQS